MRDPREQRLIQLYCRRKDLRTRLLLTHHIGCGTMRRPLRLNLEEWAVQRRAALWPELDRPNAEIRKLKEELERDRDSEEEQDE